MTDLTEFKEDNPVNTSQVLEFRPYDSSKPVDYNEDKPVPASKVIQKPYDPSRLREGVRVGLVISSLVLLTGLLIVGVYRTRDFAEFKELLVIVFSPIIAIFSAALAFYFADKKS